MLKVRPHRQQTRGGPPLLTDCAAGSAPPEAQRPPVSCRLRLHGLVVLCTGFLKENYLGVTNAVCFTWKPRSFSYHLLHHPSCSLLVVQAACCFKLPICSNGSIVELLVWSICTFVKAFYEAQRMPGHSWIPRNNFSQKLLNIIIKINELFY